jgi:hypothetical protein
MSLLTLIVTVHVLVAILGVGLVAAIPVVAASARQAKLETSLVPVLDPMLRTLRVSLALMLLSGAYIEYSAGGAYHGTWWFRLSVLALVFLFVAHRRARTALLRDTLVGVEQWGWTMCGAVAFITFLMMAKPF